eukprot:Skav223271  [mRNA]  locus=scaffold3424:92693:94842:+ [translate_table: standard]
MEDAGDPPEIPPSALSIGAGEVRVDSLPGVPLAVDRVPKPEPPDTLLPHPAPVPADRPAELAMDAVSTPVPSRRKSIKQKKPKGSFCKIMNHLSVAAEVRFNEVEEWHVFYPEQVKTIEYEAPLAPEVSVRLREDYEIQSKLRMEEVSGILNVPEDFGRSFGDEAKSFINKQVQEASNERRLSDERQAAITKKVNAAINRLTHRRQRCLVLCTTIIQSILLGLLALCTVASFGFNYDAPEQWGLGFAMVLLLYFSCTALFGGIGMGGSDQSRLQNRLRSMGSKVQNFNAESLIWNQRSAGPRRAAEDPCDAIDQ